MPPIPPTGPATSVNNAGPNQNGPQNGGMPRRNSSPAIMNPHGGGPNPRGIFATASGGMGPPPLPPRPGGLAAGLTATPFGQHNHLPGASVLRANAGDYDPDDPNDRGGSVLGDDFVAQEEKNRKRSSSFDMASAALSHAQTNFDKVVMSTVAQSQLSMQVMAEVSASSQRASISAAKTYFSLLRS